MKKKRNITRRTVLRGACGSALALPLLEVMTDSEVSAQDAPKRYVMMFAGMSSGRDRLGTANLVPSQFGATYGSPLALQPLEQHGVKGAVSVVSDLTLPYTGAGRVEGKAHAGCLSSQLAGKPRGAGASDDSFLGGASSDFLVSQHLGSNMLTYIAQPAGYRANATRGRIAYRSGGKDSYIQPQASPLQAWRALEGAANAAAGQTDPGVGGPSPELLRRHSLVDLVRARSETLRTQLGHADRNRLSEHFDAVRDIERELAALKDNPEAMEPTSATCDVSPNPGADPTTTVVNDDRNVRVGYSGETERARAFNKIIRMALACDLTRVVSFQLTYAQCFMNTKPSIGTSVTSDMHQLNHGSGTERDAGLAQAWHVEHFANLLRLLQDTPEGAGNMLDNTAALLTWETGFGKAPPGESAQDFGSHSGENMVVLVGGRLGGLRPGRHIDGNGANPASVILSAMRATGYQGNLGDINQGFDAVY